MPRIVCAGDGVANIVGVLSINCILPEGVGSGKNQKEGREKETPCLPHSLMGHRHDAGWWRMTGLRSDATYMFDKSKHARKFKKHCEGLSRGAPGERYTIQYINAMITRCIDISPPIDSLFARDAKQKKKFSGLHVITPMQLLNSGNMSSRFFLRNIRIETCSWVQVANIGHSLGGWSRLGGIHGLHGTNVMGGCHRIALG